MGNAVPFANELLDDSREFEILEKMRPDCSPIAPWGIDIEKYPFEKIIDCVDDAINGKACDPGYEFCNNDDDCDLEVSVEDNCDLEAPKLERALPQQPTMEKLSTLETQNDDLQSQLASTTEQLSTLQSQNDDLLSELMKLHSTIEMTKERYSTRVYSLQKDLEVEQSRAKDTEIEAALALGMEQLRATAAEEDAALALELAKEARVAILESAQRLKLEGSCWDGTTLLENGSGTNVGGRSSSHSEPVVEGMTQLQSIVKDYCGSVEDMVDRLREKISWRRRWCWARESLLEDWDICSFWKVP